MKEITPKRFIKFLGATSFLAVEACSTPSPEEQVVGGKTEQAITRF